MRNRKPDPIRQALRLAAAALLVAAFPPAAHAQPGGEPHHSFTLGLERERPAERYYNIGERLHFYRGVKEVSVRYALLSLHPGNEAAFQSLAHTQVNPQGRHEVEPDKEFCLCVEIQLNRTDNDVTLFPKLELSDGGDPHRSLRFTRATLNRKPVDLDLLLKDGKLRPEWRLTNLMQGENSLQLFGTFVDPEETSMLP